MSGHADYPDLAAPGFTAAMAFPDHCGSRPGQGTTPHDYRAGRHSGPSNTPPLTRERRPAAAPGRGTGQSSLHQTTEAVVWGSGIRFGCPAGSDAVLMGESAEDLLPADLVLGEADRLGWTGVCLSRGELVEGAMRPGRVVVPQVLDQHPTQVPLVDDQQPDPLRLIRSPRPVEPRPHGATTGPLPWPDVENQQPAMPAAGHIKIAKHRGQAPYYS
jgi:hypothetical protein